MRKSLSLVSLLIFVIGSFYCTSQFSSGTYCADVERYNPKTYSSSSYRLKADVSGGKITRIYWPNGGHLDESDFRPVSIEDRQSSFADTLGQQYKITLLKKGNDCFNDVLKAYQCKALTKSGRRCKNMTDNDDGRCYVHGKLTN